MKDQKSDRIKEQEKAVGKLKVQIDGILESMEHLKQQLVEVRNRYTIELNTLNQLLKADQPLTVSDHAVLRFLERRDGIDVDNVRKTIKALVETGVPEWNGMKFIRQGNVVVTSYESNAQEKMIEGNRKWYANRKGRQ